MLGIRHSADETSSCNSKITELTNRLILLLESIVELLMNYLIVVAMLLMQRSGERTRI